MLWEPTPYEDREVYRWKCKVFRAAVVYLRRAQGRQYVIVMPTVFGRPERGAELPDFVQKELKRQILSKQYNRQFNDELEHWRKVLFPKGAGPLEFPPKAASSFRFKVRGAPAFARINALQARAGVRLPEKFLDLVQFDGRFCRSRSCVFREKMERGWSRMRIRFRGLVANRPFDFALTAKGVDTDVPIGCRLSEGRGREARGLSIEDWTAGESEQQRGFLLDYWASLGLRAATGHAPID